MTSIDKHLSKINTRDLLEFRLTHFTQFASAFNPKLGLVELGFDPIGNYIVKTSEDKEKFKTPVAAINRYAERLKQEYSEKV